MLDQITPLILTFNEAPNIGRCLERLAWAREIVIVDSFSTDETLAIAGRFPRVRVVQRKFDTFADQCNFGLEQVRSAWVLSLDADYILPANWTEEIKALPGQDKTAGYSAEFRYCVFGHPLRNSLYPPRIVLYRRDKARYRNDGHGHRVQVEGTIEPLINAIDHDDRKPLDRWLQEQNKYAIAETQHLLETPPEELNFADRLRRKIIVAPLLVFVYTLFAKSLIFDGLPGWYYAFQRTLAEVMLSLRLLEAKLKSSSPD